MKANQGSSTRTTVGGWGEHKGQNSQINVPGISSTRYPNTWAPSWHWFGNTVGWEAGTWQVGEVKRFTSF